MSKLKIGCMLLALLPVGLFLIVAVAALFNGKVGVETDLSKSALLAKPPSPLSEPVTLKIVTYNIQDLWVVGFNRKERMAKLAEKLTELDPDIVGFQEAFIADERQILIDGLSKGRLKHHQYYRSATVGSGVLISSVFPIREAFFHRYSVANPWYKVWEGDWWAGKGVGLARIELPEGKGIVDFYDTHAQAGYHNPSYDLVRKQQMAELAAFINESRTQAGPAFQVGDMNCRAGEPDFETAIQGAKLFRVMAVESSIDHVFAVSDPQFTFEVLETVEISEHDGVRLSDHNGFMTTVRVSPAGQAPVEASAPAAEPAATPAP